MTSERDPQTPRNKDSSSSLLAAFKSLTGSKSRHPSSSGLGATPSATPPVSTTSNPFDLSSNRTLSELSLDGEAAGALKAAGDLRAEDAARHARSSGPPGLRSLLGDLRPDKSVTQRISAANAITKLLSQYTGADVVAIWTSGKHLLELDHAPKAVLAGYELLNACVTHKELSPVETKLFFQSISPIGDPQFLSMRLKILRVLTDDGRHLSDVGLGFLEFLKRLLHHTFSIAHAARRNRKKHGHAIKNEEINLYQTYDYVLDVLKYNSKSFSAVDHDQFISIFIPMAKQTTEMVDLEKTISIIDALTTYSCLPDMSLPSCIEILCATFSSVPDLKSTAWRTVTHLLGSHLGPATIHHLILLLKGAPDRGSVRSTEGITRGACQLVTTILQSSEDVARPPETIMPKLVSACRQSLEIASPKLDVDTMKLVLQLCSGDDATSIIFNDKIWANIEAIVIRCAGTDASRSQNYRTFFALGELGRSSPASRESSQTEENPFSVTRQVAEALVSISDEVNAEERLQVMRLLMRVVAHLEDAQAEMLIDIYLADCLLYTFQTGWREDCRALMTFVFKDYDRSTNVRRHALRALCAAHDTGDALGSPDVDDLLLDILHCISPEPELPVIEDLCQIAIDASTDTQNEHRFIAIVECLKVALHEGAASVYPASVPSPLATFAQRAGYHAERAVDGLSTSIARAIVKIFLRTMNVSDWKAKLLYDEMLTVARSSRYPAEARIIVLKLLFRLRAETNHSIFVVSATECEGIAALLCRTADTAAEHSNVKDSPILRPSRIEDQFARRSNPSAAPRSLNRNVAAQARLSPTTSRMHRPTPPLWLYPGPKGLPEEPPGMASRVLSSKRKQADSDEKGNGRTVLRIGAWLELLLEILQQDELEWEVYSYSLVHLGAQLTNHALFVEAIPQVQMLRSVICSQLANKNFHEPPPFTGLQRSDAAICLYHILTMLVSYRQYSSKNQEDDLVKMFINGISSRERTSEICIHALSVACHELPGSLTKMLDNTLQRMAQTINQPLLAVHVLEFLASLSRLPELIKNFREEEFKIVFTICLNYLQQARETRIKGTERWSLRESISTSRPNSVAKDSGIGSRPTSVVTSAVAEDVPQYVHALTYHVLIFWFMSLKLQDRNRYIGWISEKLTYRDSNGREVMEEQGQVTIDMMQRVAFSDRDETAPDPLFANENDGLRTTKSWVVGKSIVTIETAGRTGFSQIVRRRPTGTTFSTFRPTIVKPPRHQAPITIGTAAESFYTDEYVGILPEHVFQEFYAFQDYLSTPFSIELPQEDAVTRAINSFDRISPLDGHKVGIIYVSEGQRNETEILSNIMGSADYTSFLGRIGTLINLRDAKLNTQGLDRGDTETDGKFTFAWRDRVTELVFHVTTMMPNHEHDKERTLKKRHVGNDFVNIIFNNSGMTWNIDTIPSDFNSVNIVVAPEARSSFVETRLQAAAVDEDVDVEGASRPTTPDAEACTHIGDSYGSVYYKVTVLTKPGIPALSPAHTTKIVSGASLPDFVRLLALNASSFAQMWANRESAGGTGEHPSSWRSRLQEIAKLRARYGPQEGVLEPPRSSAGTSSQPSSATAAMPPPPSKTLSVQSTASSIAARDSVVFRRQSKPNIFGGTGADAIDMERSSSAGSSTRN
ncbi:MAG: hypothetical protein Q9162_005617 [Coniocarpon cinnabarinum]